MSGLMAGKIVVITGGGSGIGAASAAQLAEQGAEIILGYHNNSTGAEEVLATLSGTGHICLPIVINDADSVALACSEIKKRFGRVDLLINSAGQTTPIPLNDLDALTDEKFEEICALNLGGTFAVIRAFRPLLERSEGAAVVNIGSLAGQTGVGSNLAYCASKAGLHNLTKGLARILAPKVRVFTVSPGGVDTDFVKGRNPSGMIKNAEKTPLKKVTTAPDVGRAILACCALLGSSTGIEITVDEGRHLIGWPLFN